MKCLILFASPRKNGNTKQLVSSFIDEIEKEIVQCNVFSLYDMKIEPCIACRKCQKDWSKFGCWYKDDVQKIYDEVLESDLVLFATPIYSWYCTPPMKALLDRFVYGMNKYYGVEKGPSIWAGKKVAFVSTCGYPVEKGADIFIDGMERYCKHSKLQYLGFHVEHDSGYDVKFMDDNKDIRIRNFAKSLL